MSERSKSYICSDYGKGKVLIDSIFPNHENRIHELMSALSHDEKTETIQILKKLGLSIKDLSY